jgi:hypothetical protein
MFCQKLRCQYSQYIARNILGIVLYINREKYSINSILPFSGIKSQLKYVNIYVLLQRLVFPIKNNCLNFTFKIVRYHHSPIYGYRIRFSCWNYIKAIKTIFFNILALLHLVRNTSHLKVNISTSLTNVTKLRLDSVVEIWKRTIGALFRFMRWRRPPWNDRMNSRQS